ncbi:hypothetical protein ACJJTC_012425 [Scirpophaga incertulas]
MERQYNSNGIESLPGGDRRGTSGADAGRHSMRTVSGSPLNRRAGVGETENATAEWGGPGYIGRLHMLFSERNPNNPKIHKFNGNTLSNQARRIIKQNVISTQLLNQIQNQAEGITTETDNHIQNEPEQEPQTHQSPPNRHTSQSTRNPEHNTTEQAEIIEQLTQNVIVDENQDPLILNFLQALAETRETAVAERPFLPKAKINKQFLTNLHTLNKYLPNLLVTNTTLRDINNIIYAAAKTLILNNNQSPYVPKDVTKKQIRPTMEEKNTD